MDGSGTINPAQLDSSALVSPPATVVAVESSPRGIKRSRTPDGPDDTTVADGLDDDDKPRKRGRPKKGESPSATTPARSTPALIQTPQLKAQAIHQASPTQVSPPKSTPTGSKVKALPNVRDHTTDQLNEAGDEYIPREWDEAGERKVEETGHLRDGREYRCRTFLVPNRGNKLFMLATECARVLNYRDSYLLFNKNRSLHKIIASQVEKDDLIHQDVLPYSYRSRQIAIVTAKSMYRQFGSRMIKDGRRVRDDYWETKARKQGFTEEDPAGEKRPGTNKHREEAAAQANSTNASAMNTLAHGEIVYRNGPGIGEMLQQNSLGIAGLAPGALGQIPMINPNPSDDPRARDYGNVQRPRQDITGATPFQDRTQPSSATEIVGHAAQSAEFNKTLNQARQNRNQYYQEHWKREHPPIPSPEQLPAVPDSKDTAQMPQNFQSPQGARSGQGIMNMSQQHMLPQQPGQTSMINPQAFAQQQPQGLSQSPLRGGLPQQMRPGQMHPQNPGMNYGVGGPAGSPYAFQQAAQMWHSQPTQQPHPHGQPSLQQFHHPQQGSPLQQQSSHHLQHQMQAQAGSMPSMYQNMQAINPAQFQNMAARGMFQGSPSPAQQFIQQSAAGQQAGMSGWTPQAGMGQPNWQSF